ncbi:hypothetical protein [Streptomyces sp. NPDC088794]|uniref:hypothetical protein n=1 Tax=Streptomyces sp. NPDC088794 TaxID=3365902 RepID=UPI00381CCA89
MRDYLFLLLGIPAGIVSNGIYQYLKIFTSRRIDRIKLEGVWGEHMGESGERQCSIGEIRYDLRRRMWAFDGTNYHNDGRPYCHWVTLTSYFDNEKREFYYTFSNTLAETGQTGYIGFGVLRFRRQDRKWVPDRGFFISGTEGESYRSHSVVPLERIPDNPQEAHAVFVAQLGMPEN